MFTTAFWKATAERAVKTFAQGLLAAIGTGVTGLLDVAWGSALSFAGLAALLSVLTSLASARIGRRGGPSFGGLEVLEKLEKLPTR